jgi:hypothetical protein
LSFSSISFLFLFSLRLRSCHRLLRLHGSVVVTACYDSTAVSDCSGSVAITASCGSVAAAAPLEPLLIVVTVLPAARDALDERRLVGMAASDLNTLAGVRGGTVGATLRT